MNGPYGSGKSSLTEPEFHADYPRILGGVLDAIAGGLRERPSEARRAAAHGRLCRVGRSGRARPGGGTETFARTYKENRREAAEVMLEDSPVADALLQLARSEPGLTTPASELHARLTRNAGKRIAASAGWPQDAQHVRPRAAPDRTPTPLAGTVHHVRAPEGRPVCHPRLGTCVGQASRHAHLQIRTRLKIAPAGSGYAD